ncbi:TetR/AcrR family transcriptional regulator C-terminal domain-containing protein [Amycolatopsis sp. NPDC059657]|uniref:TetR/AcrR family transcriptional regulator C-terminal domain-containing protein n=1 Tax=Amycolatopsis sp. NPDC059657 TaxID=3346899 RepID=UPI0036721A32
MALVREEVVKAALRLLDDVGLENLSLRKLARELGIQAPTLYWHFKNKQDLLDEMHAAAMASVDGLEGAPGPGAEWDAWLAWMARRIRRGMLAHRDGALLASAARPIEERWEYVEGIVEMLGKAGFTPSAALRGIGVLTDFVLGTTLEEQQAANRVGAPVPPDPERFPMAHEAVLAAGDHDRRFEHGLALILDGMRASTSEL